MQNIYIMSEGIKKLFQYLTPNKALATIIAPVLHKMTLHTHSPQRLENAMITPSF